MTTTINAPSNGSNGNGVKENGEKMNGSNGYSPAPSTSPQQTPTVQTGDFVPPHSIDMEQQVLGCVLIDGIPALTTAEEMLDVKDFYRENHQVLFKAMSSLRDKGVGIDFPLMIAELTKAKRLEAAGGKAYLMSLCECVASTVNLPHYAAQVRECASRRSAIEAAMATIHQSLQQGSSVDAILENLEKTVSSAVAKSSKNTKAISKIGDLIAKVYDSIEEHAESGGGLPGTQTGLEAFDAVTLGLQDGDLIIIGARPSVGKTAACMTVLGNVALSGVPTAFFSLEMTEGKVAERFLASGASVESRAIKTAQLDEGQWDSMAQFAQITANVPLYIDDSSEQTLATIKAKIRRLVKDHGVRLVGIDYLTLMKSAQGGNNRVKEVGDMALGLKNLAKELHIPIILLSQLSRGVEGRQDKRPMMSDLRESGEVEQHADIIVLLYRQGYYDNQAKTKSSNTYTEQGGGYETEVAEWIIGKNREGETGMVRVGFQGAYGGKFVNLEDPMVPPDFTEGDFDPILPSEGYTSDDLPEVLDAEFAAFVPDFDEEASEQEADANESTNDEDDNNDEDEQEN